MCGSSVISYITYVRNAIVCLSLKNINLLINYSLLAKEKLCKNNFVLILLRSSTASLQV